MFWPKKLIFGVSDTVRPPHPPIEQLLLKRLLFWPFSSCGDHVWLLISRVWYMYSTQVRKIDSKYHDSAAVHVGPLEQGFGEILCLVVGQYGEISQDLRDLLKQLVSAKAKHIYLLEGRFLSSFTTSGEGCQYLSSNLSLAPSLCVSTTWLLQPKKLRKGGP